MRQNDGEAGVIVEFRKVGRSVKVTAVCTQYGDEASIVGDPSVPQQQLQALAVRKLRFIQEKKNKAR